MLHLHSNDNLKKLFVTARYYTYKVLIKVDIGILPIIIVRNLYFVASPQQSLEYSTDMSWLGLIDVNLCLFNENNLSKQQKITNQNPGGKCTLTLKHYGSNLWAEVDFSANLITNYHEMFFDVICLEVI